jgi:hypothetical protein
LTRFPARRRILKDFDRLSPYSRSVPLIGRQPELASLRAFLDQPGAVRVRVVTGTGGIGKTRLALELCEQRAHAGWDTGFATGREMKRFLAHQNLSAWGWQHPALIIVDYAAQHAETLGAWIGELAERQTTGGPPLRLLLLEREARADSGWWSAVFESGGYGAGTKLALLDPAQPWPVQPLADVEARLELLDALLKSVEPKGALKLPTTDPGFRKRLMSVEWGGDPLSLLMAGLTMVQHGHTQALVARRTDLAEQLAAREAERIRALAEAVDLDATLVLHLAASATLAQGMTRLVFEGYADIERNVLRRTAGGDAANIADLLCEALPRADGGIAPVLPDLVGEAFTLRCLKGSEPRDAVLRCHATVGDAVTESLVRTVQDYATANPVPLQWLDALISSVFDDPVRLAAVDVRLPYGSTALRSVNLRVAQRRAELDAGDPQANSAGRAQRFGALALALSENGKREPALAAAREALELYRELAAARPDVFKPDLARSLIVLALRIEEAAASANSGVEARQYARESLAELILPVSDAGFPGR